MYYFINLLLQNLFCCQTLYPEVQYRHFFLLFQCFILLSDCMTEAFREILMTQKAPVVFISCNRNCSVLSQLRAFFHIRVRHMPDTAHSSLKPRMLSLTRLPLSWNRSRTLYLCRSERLCGLPSPPERDQSSTRFRLHPGAFPLHGEPDRISQNEQAPVTGTRVSPL